MQREPHHRLERRRRIREIRNQFADELFLRTLVAVERRIVHFGHHQCVRREVIDGGSNIGDDRRGRMHLGKIDVPGLDGQAEHGRIGGDGFDDFHSSAGAGLGPVHRRADENGGVDQFDRVAAGREQRLMEGDLSAVLHQICVDFASDPEVTDMAAAAHDQVASESGDALAQKTLVDPEEVDIHRDRAARLIVDHEELDGERDLVGDGAADMRVERLPELDSRHLLDLAPVDRTLREVERRDGEILVRLDEKRVGPLGSPPVHLHAEIDGGTRQRRRTHGLVLRTADDADGGDDGDDGEDTDDGDDADDAGGDGDDGGKSAEHQLSRGVQHAGEREARPTSSARRETASVAKHRWGLYAAALEERPIARFARFERRDQLISRFPARRSALMAVGDAFASAAFAVFAAFAVCTAASAAEPAPRWILPLDVPVSVESSVLPGDPRIVLLDRPDGTWLYRVESGRLLAFLPPVDLTSDLTSLGGRPLEALSDDVAWPACVRPLQNWPVRLSSEPTGPPAVVDLEGDGIAEIVVALEDGQIAALTYDGGEAAGWPVVLDGPLRDAPGVSDLDRDGEPEILAATIAGSVHCIGPGGVELAGWPVQPGTPEGETLWSTPISAVLEADEEPSLAVAATYGTVHLLDPRGQVRRGWPFSATAWREVFNRTSCYASPTSGDLDRDGRLELVLGSNSGDIHVAAKSGRALSGWPRDLSAQRRVGFGRVQAVDLGGDGRLELIAASDRGFPGGARVAVWSGDGTIRRGWPVEVGFAVNDGVALGDLDGRAGLEIVVATLGGDAQIHALRSDGSALPGWPRTFRRTSFDSGVVLADIDGREGPEILALGALAEYGTGALLFAFHPDGETLPGFPVEFTDCFGYGGGLTVADLDGDGLSELLVALAGRPQIVALHTLGRAADAAWPRSGRGRDGVPGAPGVPVARPVGPLDSSANRGPARADVETGTLGDRLPSSLDAKRTLSFVLRRPTPIRLEVLDVRGRRVRRLLDGPMPSGLYAISWDGETDAGGASPSGAYFFQLLVNGRVEARQNILLVK